MTLGTSTENAVPPAGRDWYHVPVEYGVLGQLRVGTPERDLTPPGQRARDVLAVLLTRRDQAVDPTVLLDLAWGDEAISLDISVVYTLVARLRRTLGREAIETTGRGYRLRSVEIDDLRFGDLVEQAQRCRTQEPARAIELLREGLDLWRGDHAYADISDHLVAAEVGRLRERRAGATEMLAELLLARSGPGDLDELIVLTDAFVLRDPLLERAHELLMLALWRSGRQADALSAYERLRVLLRDELGVDPSAATAQLHLQMLTQDPDLGAPAARTPVRPTSAPPAPTTPLVGREEELSQVLGLMAERRLVVITGLGGVGKSRLISEVHRRLDPGTATAFLDLSTLAPEREDLVEGLGRAILAPLDSDNLMGSLVTALGHRELLLMIDEAERSTTSVAAVLSELLAGCHGLRVLVASRRPVGVVGETLVPLDPLEVPREGAPVEEVVAAASVRLLRTRIGDHAPAMALGDRETLALGRFARKADGLPLALELLAGYAGTHSLEEMEAVLDSPSSLESEEFGRPPRHRTLRKTIQWTVERLPDGHRQVLRRLGVFSGSFEFAGAIAVAGLDCPDADRATRALVREGLIQARREDGVLLLRLPRAVRDLAAAGLEERGELAAARRRHRRWHATERWSDELRNDELNADVQRHYPDYLAALRSGLEDRDSETIGTLVLTLGRFWGYCNTVPVGRRWFEEVLQSGLTDERAEAKVRVMRANLMVHDDPETTRSDLDTALLALDTDEDAGFLVTAFILRSMERYESGCRDEAVVAAQQAVDVSSLAHRERRADALGVLSLAQATVDPVAARRTADEAWALADGSGNPASRASVATNVALARLEIGEPEEALALLAHAARDLGDDVPLFIVFNTAWAQLECAQPAAALDGFLQVIAACGDSLGTRTAAEALAGAASACLALDLDAADALVAGARELLVRTELVMQSYQLAPLDKAAVERPWAGLPWPETTEGLGQQLADLVRASREQLAAASRQVSGGHGA